MDTTHDLGLDTLRRLLGEQRAGAVVERFAALSPTFEREAIAVVFGRTWSRGGIDIRTRALLSIGILAAQGRQGALRIVFEIARNNGVTEDEIVEALLQVGIYAGYPAALDALATLETTREKPSAS
jgi:4-carboxymuconolactone decarboxylase